MTTASANELAADELRKKYRVVAKLGEGGMALVHLAVSRGIAGVRKLVVLKSIRPELGADPRMAEMFLAEARLAATLNHPNIVQTFEVALISGVPVLVMEYLDGQPLSRILHGEHRAAVPLSVQLFVLKETLAGLEYAHSVTDLDGTPLNLVHRDVSPQNVFVTYDGHVTLIDFGIAKQMGASSNTEVGVLKGKVRYMPPEQLTQSARLDGRADVFAVGVMLWEALTRRRMWDGVADLMVMKSLLRGKVPTPSSVAADVPPALEAICMKALALNCADRHESAAAMQAELEQAARDLGLETTGREVGRFVGELFSELRSTMRKIIEDQLRKDSNAKLLSLVVSDEGQVLAAEDAGGVVAWSMPPPGASLARDRGGVQRRRRRWAALASLPLLAAAAVASVGALGPRHKAGPAATRLVPSSSAAAERAQEQGTRSVNASVVDTARSTGSAAASAEAPLVIRARAAASLAADPPATSRDPEVTPAVPLFRKPRAVGSPPSPRPARLSPQPSAMPAQPPAAPAPSCSPPFYFDEEGIKRPKQECLQ